MKDFKKVFKEEKELSSVICNKCAKEIKFVQEGFLEVEKKWGYFSDFDMSIHSFDICQECYKTFVATFAKPISVTGYFIA